MNLIIIGAGAAGLMAAKKLAPHYNITILEAGARVGGRIYTKSSVTDERAMVNGDSDATNNSTHATGSVIEGGAEFIHGRLPVTLSLLDEAGLTYTAIGGKTYHVFDGHWEQDEDFVSNWQELISKMGSIEEDMTMQAFLDLYFSGDEYEELRSSVIMYVRGYDLADEYKVSVRYLYEEWSSEEPVMYRVDAGYGAMIEYLAREVSIITNCVVTGIQWIEGQAVVIAADGRHFEADRVLVTVPLSMLQQGAITFTPAINHYQAAAQQIGWGSVTKVIFEFKYAFWKEKDLGFLISDQRPPVWWAQEPSDAPVLTGWWAGFTQESDEALQQTALSSLTRIFGFDVTELLVNNYVFNWAKASHTSGAYSYDTPSSGDARQLLTTPLSNTLYFAGEALYLGDRPGTVEAALVSGIQAAERLLTKSNNII